MCVCMCLPGVGLEVQQANENAHYDAQQVKFSVLAQIFLTGSRWRCVETRPEALHHRPPLDPSVPGRPDDTISLASKAFSHMAWLFLTGHVTYFSFLLRNVHTISFLHDVSTPLGFHKNRVLPICRIFSCDRFLLLKVFLLSAFLLPPSKLITFRQAFPDPIAVKYFFFFRSCDRKEHISKKKGNLYHGFLLFFELFLPSVHRNIPFWISYLLFTKGLPFNLSLDNFFLRLLFFTLLLLLLLGCGRDAGNVWGSCLLGLFV